MSFLSVSRSPSFEKNGSFNISSTLTAHLRFPFLCNSQCQCQRTLLFYQWSLDENSGRVSYFSAEAIAVLNSQLFRTTLVVFIPERHTLLTISRNCLHRMTRNDTSQPDWTLQSSQQPRLPTTSLVVEPSSCCNSSYRTVSLPMWSRTWTCWWVCSASHKRFVFY